MITVDMTVREAINVMWLLSNNLETKTLRDRLIKAIEIAAGDANTSLTLHSIPRDKWIYAIKTIRHGMGWSLKDSKDFCEVVRGEAVTTATRTDDYSPWGEATHYETHYEGGKPNTLSASSKAINDMAVELRQIGCTVTTG